MLGVDTSNKNDLPKLHKLFLVCRKIWLKSFQKQKNFDGFKSAADSKLTNLAVVLKLKG